MARADRRGEPGTWVLLSYRIPREPSTPRMTIWRKLKRLGVGQISDGLVALPADGRTREVTICAVSSSITSRWSAARPGY